MPEPADSCGIPECSASDGAVPQHVPLPPVLCEYQLDVYKRQTERRWLSLAIFFSFYGKILGADVTREFDSCKINNPLLSLIK